MFYPATAMQTGWQTVEINAQKGEKINIRKLSLGRSCTKPNDRSVVCNLYLPSAVFIARAMQTGWQTMEINAQKGEKSTLQNWV